MAFRSATQNQGNSATPSVAVPAGASIGDIVIICVSLDTNSPSLAQGVWPAGFTRDSGFNLTLDTQTTAIGWKRLTAADTGSYTFASVGTAAPWAIGAVCLSGRHATNPPVFTALANNSANASPVSIGATGLTASANDDLVWAATPDVNTAAAGNGFTAPASYTERVDIEDTALGWSNVGIATRDNVSAGATGTVTGTFALASGAAGWSAWLVRVPAAPVGGPGIPVLVGSLMDITSQATPYTLPITVDVPADARLVVVLGTAGRGAARTWAVSGGPGGFALDDSRQTGMPDADQALTFSAKVTTAITAPINLTLTPSGLAWGVSALAYYITDIDHTAPVIAVGGTAYANDNGTTWTSGALNPGIETGTMVAVAFGDDVNATGSAATAGADGPIGDLFSGSYAWATVAAYAQLAVGSGGHTISGTFADNAALGSAVSAVIYRRNQAWVDIAGATGSTFNPTSSELGKNIRSVIIGVDADGSSAPVASNALGPVTAASGHNITIGQVVETDTAQALTRKKQKAILQVTETDSAQPLTETKRKTILQVIETNIAQALTRRKSRTIAQVIESDVAQVLTHFKRQLIGQVTETNTAQALAFGGDLFQRANENPLASPWVPWLTPLPQLLNNAAYPASGDYGDAILSGLSYGPDLQATLEMTGNVPWSGLLRNVGIGARLTTATSAAGGYAVEITGDLGSGFAVRIWKTNSWGTPLAISARTDYTNVDAIRIRLVGTSIIGLIRTNGVWTKAVQTTDSTYTAAGMFGFWTQTPTPPGAGNVGIKSIAWAPAGPLPSPILAQVVETDVAQALAKSFRKTVTQVAETNLAQALTRRKSKSIAAVTETDVAQALTRRKVRTVAQVSETNTAQPLVRSKRKAINQTVETDVAQALAHAKRKALIQVLETGIAQGLAKAGSNILGRAIETDVSQPLSHLKRVGLQIVTETDVSMALSRVRSRVLALVSEVDTAQPLVHPKRKALLMVVETDLAQPLARRHSRLLGLAVETDTPQSITAGARMNRVIETDIAQNIRTTRFRAINLVTETDLARTLARLKTPTLGRVTEIDIAQALQESKRKSILIVSETDLARPFVRLHSRVIVQVIEVDTARPLTSAKVKAILRVIETDTAGHLAHGVAVRQAVEIDLARPLSTFFHRYIRLQQAVEVNTAGKITFTRPDFGTPTSGHSSRPGTGRPSGGRAGHSLQPTAGRPRS